MDESSLLVVVQQPKQDIVVSATCNCDWQFVWDEVLHLLIIQRRGDFYFAVFAISEI